MESRIPSLFSMVCDDILEAMLFSKVAKGCRVSAQAELPVVLAAVLSSSCIVKPSTGLCTALRPGTCSSSCGAPSLWLTSALAMILDYKRPKAPSGQGQTTGPDIPSFFAQSCFDCGLIIGLHLQRCRLVLLAALRDKKQRS